jgi:hypothetical protein
MSATSLNNPAHRQVPAPLPPSLVEYSEQDGTQLLYSQGKNPSQTSSYYSQLEGTHMFYSQDNE